jgi:hypothetical protein
MNVSGSGQRARFVRDLLERTRVAKILSSFQWMASPKKKGAGLEVMGVYILEHV